LILKQEVQWLTQMLHEKDEELQQLNMEIVLETPLYQESTLLPEDPVHQKAPFILEAPLDQHAPGEQDAVLEQTKEELSNLKQEVERLTKLLREKDEELQHLYLETHQTTAATGED